MLLFDPWYFVFMAPAMLLALWASFKVRSAFQQGEQFAASSGLSGAEAARSVMYNAGVMDARVELTEGYLSDHYDPTERVLRLSPKVYYGQNLSALGVAAHEAGHALQHSEGYTLLTLRNAIVPLASIGSNMAWIILLAGFFMVYAQMALGTWVIWAGIALFSLVVLFQLVNLPVEFDASRRARLLLLHNGMVTQDEDVVVGRVLRAAAMTYVAATLTAILELAYWLMRASVLADRE